MLSGVPEWRTHLNSSVGSKCADINCWASSHVQNWSTRRPCSKQGQVLIPHLDFHWKFCGKLDQNCGRLLPKRTAGSPPLINVVHRPRRRRGSTSEENKEVPPAVLILYPEGAPFFWSTNVSIEISSTKWGPILEKRNIGIWSACGWNPGDEPIAAHMCLTQNIYPLVI